MHSKPEDSSVWWQRPAPAIHPAAVLPSSGVADCVKQHNRPGATLLHIRARHRTQRREALPPTSYRLALVPSKRVGTWSGIGWLFLTILA